jgi:hypothetical protein
MIRRPQAHPRLARLLVRGPIRSWVSRRVWAELEARPGFMEAIVGSAVVPAMAAIEAHDKESAE